MNRGTLLAVATGGLLLAGVPHSAAFAQSGDALAHAERTCLDFGIRPHTDSYDVCVGRAANAFDDGAPNLAYSQARAVLAARDTCLSLGTLPRTLGYRQCLNVEIDRRAGRTYAIDREAGRTYALRYTDDGPHRIVRMDQYGNRYDRDGNLVDRYGYVMRPAPY